MENHVSNFDLRNLAKKSGHSGYSFQSYSAAMYYVIHHARKLLVVVCLQVVSQGFGGALANLDDQG